MPSKRLLLITTGGTIGGQTAMAEPTSDSNGFSKLLENVIGRIQSDWGLVVELDELELFTKDSTEMNSQDWQDIGAEIQKNYDEYDGFVITHGTNTLGYTAAALSFSLDNINKPVVLTGSQVPAHLPGSDALTNLENATRVAVFPYHPTPRGVICVFGSIIIGGTRVKKHTDFDYDAFSSYSTKVLGKCGRYISFDVPELERHNNFLSMRGPVALRADQITFRNHFDTNLISITEFPGMTADGLESMLLASKARALIIRSFGAGDVNSALHPCLISCRENKIPVAVTTQAPLGNSNFQVNRPGVLLKEKGLAIPTFDMSIEAMTVKLAWLLGANTSYEEIQNAMLTSFHGEIEVTKEYH